MIGRTICFDAPRYRVDQKALDFLGERSTCPFTDSHQPDGGAPAPTERSAEHYPVQQSNFALLSVPEIKMSHIRKNGEQADSFSAEPGLLALFRAFPRRVQHQFIQLAIDEMELHGEAERFADVFLASSAWEIEDHDIDRASDLYPQGCTHRETWLRHKIKCADTLIQLEWRALGGAIIFIPRRPMSAAHSLGRGDM